MARDHIIADLRLKYTTLREVAEILYSPKLKTEFSNFFSLGFYTGGGQVNLLELKLQDLKYGPALLKNGLHLPAFDPYVKILEVSLNVLADIYSLREDSSNPNAVLFGPLLSYDKELSNFLTNDKHKNTFDTHLFNLYLDHGVVLSTQEKK